MIAVLMILPSFSSAFAKESLLDRAISDDNLQNFKTILSQLHTSKPTEIPSDSRGTPTLLSLISNERLPMLRFYLETYPDGVNAKDHAYVGDGRTALHQAAARGLLSVMQLLVKHGAEVTALNTSGETPLHLACRFGHLDAVKYLVSQGAPLDAKTKFTGTTPLMAAAEMGHEGVIRYLLISGAKKEIRDSFGKTAPERFQEYVAIYQTSAPKNKNLR